MKKVLNILSGSLNKGGIQNLNMNWLRNIDKNDYKLDYLVWIDNGHYEQEAISLGATIHHTVSKHKNIFKYSYDLIKIIKTSNYDIVHIHTNVAISVLDVLLIKLFSNSKVIVHSHSNNCTKSQLNLHRLFKYVLFLLPVTRLSCSIDAGKWLFGNRTFKVIPNGVDFSSIVYDFNDRNEIRNKYNINNKKVLINVARLSKEKNQFFLLEIIKRVENAVLLLVGDGNIREQIQEEIEKNHITDKVILIGMVDNVSKYLSCADIFLLPSQYEGFGTALLEAQISGLVSIASENVPKECNLCNDISFLDLDIDRWVKLINSIELPLSRKNRKEIYKPIYDENKVIQLLCEVYNKI